MKEYEISHEKDISVYTHDKVNPMVSLNPRVKKKIHINAICFKSTLIKSSHHARQS